MTLVLGGAVVGLSRIDHVSLSAEPETKLPFEILKNRTGPRK